MTSSADPAVYKSPASALIGFTLIELLVVVVIISILASMLLPALTRAREFGRRASCLGNLKQIVIATINYADDMDGLPPSTPVQFVGPTNYADSNIMRRLTENGVDPGAGVNPTGWYQLWDHDYLPRQSMLCPSEDFPGDFDGVDINGQNTTTTHQGLFGVHYSYRYNSARAVQYADSWVPAGLESPYGRAVFGGNRSRRVLFSDAADYRGVSIGGLGVVEPITETKGPWGYVDTRIKWAHGDGGHLATHDGAAFWRRNSTPPFSAHTWPGSGTPRFYYAVDRFLD